jgi:hypothetical protein
MRRAKLILAALAVVVSTFAAFSGPAMADDLNCRDARGNLIRCDGQLFEPTDNNFRFDSNFRDDNDFRDHNFDFNSGFFFGNPFVFGFDNSCPFAGDFEGIVNQSDCFD